MHYYQLEKITNHNKTIKKRTPSGVRHSASVWADYHVMHGYLHIDSISPIEVISISSLPFYPSDPAHPAVSARVLSCLPVNRWRPPLYRLSFSSSFSQRLPL